MCMCVCVCVLMNVLYFNSNILGFDIYNINVDIILWLMSGIDFIKSKLL